MLGLGAASGNRLETWRVPGTLCPALPQQGDCISHGDSPRNKGRMDLRQTDARAREAAKIADVFQKAVSFTRAKEVQAAGYYPYFIPITWTSANEVEVDGHRLVMAGSNNYLGYTHDPRVLEAAEKAARLYGTGCTGSRFLNGTLGIHEKLERDLAAFNRKEACLVFSTGFQTNLGTISSLVGRDDVVIMDKLDHASVVDGCRLADGETRRFRHNDLAHLTSILEKIEPERGRMVVVDGVFSMEGDVAPLPELVKICKQY